jgi:DNA-binding transcriptional MerR regulator
MTSSGYVDSASTPSSGESLPIAEVSARTGLSIDTLRYYERVGLISGVGRTGGGQRRYAAADLEWLGFLLRLRDTGMSISDMQEFARLRGAGPSTVADRLRLLREHREAVNARVRLLRGNLRDLDKKIDYYQGLLDQRSETEL